MVRRSDALTLHARRSHQRERILSNMRKLARVFFTSIAAGLLVCLVAGCSAKTRRARHMQRADKYFNAGQYPKAEVEYLNVLQLDSLNARAIGRLATIYYEQNRFDRAVGFLAKARELTPDDLELCIKLGNIYVAVGKPKEAQLEANVILAKIPGHAEAPVLLAEAAASPEDFEKVRQRLEELSAEVGETTPLQLAFGTLATRLGDLKAAEIAFKRAETLDPTSSAAHYALGNLFWAQNDLKGAELELKTAAELAPARSARRLRYAEFKIRTGELEAGKQLLAEVAKAAPDYLPVWLARAQIALAEQKYEECASLLGQALARDPANFDALLLRGRLMLARREAGKAIAEFERMSAPYGRSAQVHYHLALAYLLNNDTAQALKRLNQAVALDPNFAEAVLLQAQLNIRKDDSAQAITSLTDLIKRRPQLVQAHLLLATAYRAKGSLNEALGIYHRLAEVAPTNPDIPRLMGQVNVLQGNKAEARKAFGKALELAPDDLSALDQLVNLDLSEQQFSTALVRVEQQLTKKPNTAELQLLLAKVYGSQQDLDKTEGALLRAIELNPNHPQAYLLLARLYTQTGKHQKAVEKLNESLARNPQDTKALMLLGTIQSQLKEFSAARATYERLLGIEPKSYAALNNLAYLYSEQFGLLDKAYEMARRARDLLCSKAPSLSHPMGEGQGEGRDLDAANPTELLRAYSTETLGWIVFKRGEYSWALSLLQESAERLSAEPEVQFHLGMTYYMLGQEERAQAALKRALASGKDFAGKEEAARRLAVLVIDGNTAEPAVAGTLEKELQERPGDPVVLARLAAIYQREGRPDKALMAYEAALKENSKNVPVLVKLSLLCSGPGHNPQRALELAKAAYKLAPEDREISATLGRLVFDSGDYKWALSLLQQAAASRAQEPEFLCDLALAYYSVGRIADAETTMRKALQTGAAFSRTNEAKRFLELAPVADSPDKALPLEPQAQRILGSIPDYVPALVITALCAEKRGESQAARQSWERVLNQYPDFTPAMDRLALLYAESPGGHQKAYAMASRARQALPEDAEAARTLGLVLFRRAEAKRTSNGPGQDYRNAARLLEESVRKGLEDGATMYYLGMAHYRLKEANESKKALQRALALKLETNLAEEANRALAELK